MLQTHVPPDTPLERDEPLPIAPVRGRGFLLERMLTLNALVSVGMLTWSALVLRKPSLARNAWHACRTRFPRLVGTSKR